ncbi:MAG: phosphate ABC transporter permease subunit PstC, partial [Proteobacteria bacterium]|nr:phosphate ABC transporter permease subunit PstC [Pseudomonadota bacterium]
MLTKDKTEKRFDLILKVTALFVVALLVVICLTLLVASVPSIKTFGFGFIIGKTWDVASEKFGALPFLVGTLLTSFLALAISIPFSIAISIFLGEYFKEG